MINEATGVVEFRHKTERASPQLLAQLQQRVARVGALQARLQAATRDAQLEHRYIVMQVATRAVGGGGVGTGGAEEPLEPTVGGGGGGWSGMMDPGLFEGMGDEVAVEELMGGNL